MTLGILGGLGPAAGAHFYTRLVALTAAECDADHVDVLLCGRASTPDRTGAILSGRTEAFSSLLRDARGLVEAGADMLAIVCHTAHAYLADLRAALPVPILDMVSLTLHEVARLRCRRLGLLCTAGTRHARVYDGVAQEMDIELIYPSPFVQKELDHLIYKVLKCGRTDFGAALRTAMSELAARGCDAVSLSCTELSLPAAGCPQVLFGFCGKLYPIHMIDPVELLARRAIIACGKQPVREEEAHAPVPFACRPACSSSARGRMG